jgi:hypothetical protein
MDFTPMARSRLVLVQIGGNLECGDGAFNCPGRSALNANGAIIKGSVFLRDRFHSNGAVVLQRAQIGGDLDCQGGTFSNLEGDAISAEHASVKGQVLMYHPFRAEGIIDLFDCHVDGDLNCTGAGLRDATLVLTDASASSIRDDLSSWPQPGKLFLNGFVYGRISGGPQDAETRLSWLTLQPPEPFATQPYLQLAKVLTPESAICS